MHYEFICYNIFLLIVYGFIGWKIINIKGWKNTKQLFGAKTYGSLSLVLALDGIDGLFWFRRLLEYMDHQSQLVEFFKTNTILFAWIIISAIVFAIQGIVLWKDTELRL